MVDTEINYFNIRFILVVLLKPSHFLPLQLLHVFHLFFLSFGYVTISLSLIQPQKLKFPIGKVSSLAVYK